MPGALRFSGRATGNGRCGAGREPGTAGGESREHGGGVAREILFVSNNRQGRRVRRGGGRTLGAGERGYSTGTTMSGLPIVIGPAFDALNHILQ